MSAATARRRPAKPYSVLILDNEFGMGGVEKKLYDFIARRNGERVDFKVCCLKQGGYFKDKLMDLGVPFYDGLMRHRFDASAFGRLSAVLRAERVQLIYTFTHPNTVLFAYFARMRGLVDRFLVSYHAMGNPDGGRLVPDYLRFFVRRADALVATAEMHKGYLIETEGLPAHLIDVIHNGVDTVRYHPGERSSEPGVCAELGIAPDDVVFTTIASLKPAKRIDLLLDAAAPVMQEHPKLKIVLCGDGPSRFELEAAAQRHGIGGRVVFAGIRDDVDAVLRASDALVLPSRLGTETFPNVVLEAMASGVAVITTEVGSVREMVEDGGSALVVPPDDEELLRDAIARLAGDAPLRERLGARGRELAEERYRLEQMCERREDVIDKLLAPKRRRGADRAG